MNRCTRILAGLLLAVPFVSLSLTSVANAQVTTSPVREIPKDVKRGQMVITTPPVITMDGQPDRLSPGSRIRNTNNLLLLSGSVVGKTLPVIYRRDPSGLVHEVWVLTPEEEARLNNADSASGYQRFMELLQYIFGR